MNTTPRFDKALDILYTAFFEGTLAKASCSHCAVGNLVGGSEWTWLFTTVDNVQKFYSRDPDLEQNLFNKTGYKFEELAQIEYAFETNTKIEKKDYKSFSEQEILTDQFQGLCAVFKVLCELDNIPYEGFEEKLKEHPKLEKCLN